MRLLPLFLLLLLSTPLTAQHSKQQDVLRTHQGWVLRGQATAPPDSSRYTLTTEEGNVFVFAASEVLSLSREPRPKGLVPVKRQGWYFLAQTGLLMGTTGPNDPFYYEGNTAGFNLQASAGYQFRPQLSLGAGTGMTMLMPGLTQPVFAELRGDVLARSVTPHYFVAGGYLIPRFDHSEDNNIDPWNSWPEIFPPSGGPLYEAGLGIKVHKAGFAWLLTASYRYQSIGESYRDWGGARIDRTYHFQRLCLQAGMMF